MTREKEEQLPAVDETRLAEILRVKELPCGLLSSYSGRVAARVLTDALGSKLTPIVAISNAVAWIDRASRDGYNAGIVAERERWERKISAVFGLERI
jgi:hypothetical protein